MLQQFQQVFQPFFDQQQALIKQQMEITQQMAQMRVAGGAAGGAATSASATGGRTAAQSQQQQASKDVEMQDAQKAAPAENKPDLQAALHAAQLDIQSQMKDVNKTIEELKEQQKIAPFMQYAQTVADHLGISKDSAVESFKKHDAAWSTAVVNKAISARASTSVGNAGVDTKQGAKGRTASSSTSPAEVARQNFTELQKGAAARAGATSGAASAAEEANAGHQAAKALKSGAGDDAGTAGRRQRHATASGEPADISDDIATAKQQSEERWQRDLAKNAKLHPASWLAGQDERQAWNLWNVGH
jgi:hypothetical protein